LGKKIIFIVCIAYAVRHRWLECGAALALRAPRAGPTMFVTAFGAHKKVESPPLAAGESEFRTRVRPQPSEVTSTCPTSPGNSDDAAGFAPLQKAVANLNRPANGVRSAGAAPHSSQRCWTARKPQR
jgi:hypothetical protein